MALAAPKVERGRKIDKREEQLAKINAAAAAVSKRKRSAIVKAPSRRTGRIRASNWYEKAARSIGISDNRLPKRGDQERGYFEP
jgi:hypothetical protein